MLALLAQGLPNKGIARRLGISPKTVGNHVEHIYAKLGVSNRAGAAMRRHATRARGSDIRRRAGITLTRGPAGDGLVLGASAVDTAISPLRYPRRACSFRGTEALSAMLSTW